MTRKPILIGNWKLHHSKKSAGLFFRELVENLKNKKLDLDLAIAPVATMLDFAHEELKNSGVSVGAQDVFYEPKGAYTGEYSTEQLFEIGVKYCIVGHSERRRLFQESDDDTRKKAQACLRARIIPICCIGETLKEREDGHMHVILERQLKAFAAGIKEELENIQEIILAYEPVWAIGTGRSASSIEAQEAHAFIRKLWENLVGSKISSQTRIIYGGSVTPENITELVLMPEIDGALVGGASLQVESFLAMVFQLSI